MTDKAGWAGRLRATLWALLLACPGAIAQQIKAPQGPVAPLPLKAPAEQAPSIPASAALPALPAAAASIAPAPASVPSASQAGPGLRAPLGELAAFHAAARSPSADGAGAEPGRLDEAFDGRQPPDSNAPAVPVPAPAGPRLPPGFDRVTAHAVETEADVWSLIPLGYSPNSETLTRKLARDVAKMRPYEVYTYFDRRGGKVIGIDLSRKPGLVDLLPEQQSHEVRLIKKIQAWNLDLQVVVREGGATPDLIIGGVFTELKTRVSRGKSLSQLLDKANGQVSSHARRHGSGPGAVIVDLAGRQAGVPMAEIAAELDSWRRTMAAHGHAIALKKIYFFVGNELRQFDRQPDGSYAPASIVSVPFAPASAPRRAASRQPAPRTAMTDAFARDRVEKTVRHLMKKGRYRSALRVWEDFTLTAGPEEAARARQRLGSLLESAKARLDSPKPRTIRRAR